MRQRDRNLTGYRYAVVGFAVAVLLSGAPSHAQRYNNGYDRALDPTLSKGERERATSENCRSFHAPGMRDQCRSLESQVQGGARLRDAQQDLRSSTLSANARRENATCAAQIKAEIERGRFRQSDVDRARANRQGREELSCTLLRRLRKT
jgi:hypothetical protein